MMKTSLSLFPTFGLRALCLLFLPMLSTGIFAQTEAKTIIFTRANIVDGHLDKVLTNATLIVVDGKIKRITQEEVDLPGDAKVIDLAGKYLMPGLIDAHVHLRDLESAQRALYSGVTTARSMGVSHFIDVGFRELAALGKIESPEILAAGYHVRPKPDDGFFIDMPQMSDLMDAGIYGEEAISRMGEVMVAHKVDWIKVNATARAGLPQTDPREPYYSEKELRALVEVGARNGIPVAAHAHGDEGGQAAVRAGVKSIEHGTYLSEATLKLMAERGTYLVPTIAIVTDLTEPGGDYDVPFLQIRGRHMLPRVRQTAALAHSLGVKIIAATDTGYGPDGTLRLGLELEELVGVGLSPLEAIRAATSLAAEMLGIADHTGRIAIGLDADLLILEGNPLENIGAVHDPLMIVNNGKIVVNRLVFGEK
ncbi:MAG: amidohydrolase family protein [Saprospiraceae bacterium]